jgi:hypothetical protein
VRRWLLDPHVAVALGATGVIGAEIGYRKTTSVAWVLLALAAAGAALFIAWHRQYALRLAPVLMLALAIHAAYLGAHYALDVEGDIDSRLVFRWQGNAILDGYYPRSEYPAGGVLLFALEAWLGGGSTRWTNALLMVPFQLGCVWAVWSLRTRFSAWLSALVAVWPASAFYWEFKYDLAPAALLALGVLFAVRARWGWSGVALGLGTLLKWTPLLASFVLLAHLLARRRFRDAGIHVLALGAVIVAVYLPLLVWDADAVSAAYTRQGDRPITAESLWYLPLRLAGAAEVHGHISYGAGAPEWANVVAGALQLVVVAGLVVLGWRASPRRAAALAALVPALFLLTNRIFSPQFAVVVLTAWAVAAALVVRDRREQIAAGVAAGIATAANAFVYPFALPFYETTWQLASATLFAVGLALTAWLALKPAPE